MAPTPANSTARLTGCRVDLGEDAKDADHFIDYEERLRVIMARQ